MTLNIISDVWNALRDHIQLADRNDAAETLVHLLIDNDFDADEIKQSFRGDKDIGSALSYFEEHEEIVDDDDEEDWYDDDTDEW